MRTLDQIKLSDAKTNFIERIKYFEDLKDDYKTQVSECFLKQEKIRNLNKSYDNDLKQKDVLENQVIDLSEKNLELEKEIEKLKKENLKISKSYEEQLDKYVSEKNRNDQILKEMDKLNKTIDFLKNNKRAPSLNELKDYQFGRGKRSVKK